MAKRTAIIDIGSNSIRLVIYQKTSRFAFHVLNETKSRVRISEDSYKNNANLQDAAIQRTLQALKEFESIITSHKVTKTLCVATSALRDAPNKKEFLNLVNKYTKLNIKIISGEKEAYYGGLACANLLAHTNGLSIDIGGGSTEFSIIEDRNIRKSYSLNLGTVRIKELFFDTDTIDNAKSYINSILEAIPKYKVDNLIGIGGTFRSVSQLILEQTNHPLDILHSFEFSQNTLVHFLERILDSNEKQLRELGIKKERLDVIKPGALILLQVINYVNTSNVVCSTAGVREGVFLHDLLRHNKFQFPHNYELSIKILTDRFILHPKHASQREKIATKITTLLQSAYNISENEARLIRIAAKLTSLGKHIHKNSYHLHSEFLIANGLEYGFKHHEIILIAALVRFHKKKRTHDSYHEQFEGLLPSEAHFETMSFIVALSEALIIHYPSHVNINFSYDKKTLFIEGKELYLAKERIAEHKLPENLTVQFQ